MRSLEVPANLPDDKAYRFAITADKPGQFVIARVLLLPADHIDRADPDVIRFLKESRLPILRWPGGNFVSTYHWGDGVGPIEQRPTLPNYAWGQQENNFFGTDEFIAFCRAVGCEPMICVNAGSGTPAEAAQWVEYCNGDAQTPDGKAPGGQRESEALQREDIGRSATSFGATGSTTGPRPKATSTATASSSRRCSRRIPRSKCMPAARRCSGASAGMTR